MSRLDVKKAFAIQNKQSMHLMKQFIIAEMNVTLTSDWESLDTIVVPSTQYERIVVEGQKFAVLKNLSSVDWLNHYEEPVNCKFIQLGYAIFNAKEANFEWYKKVSDYLRQLKKAGIVDEYNNYHSHEQILCLESQSLDYEEKIEALNQFIEENGTGPFVEIRPLTRTGKLVEQPFPVKIKK